MSPASPTPALPAADTVRAAIDRASRALADPGRPDLGPLERELRGYAAAMVVETEAATDELWEGSPEWSRLVTRIGMVRHLLVNRPRRGR